MAENTLSKWNDLEEELKKKASPEKLNVTNTILVPALENLGAVMSVLGVIGAAYFLATGTLLWNTTWFIDFLWPVSLLIFFLLMAIRFTSFERKLVRLAILAFQIERNRNKIQSIPVIDEPIIVDSARKASQDAQNVNDALILYYNGGSITRDNLINKLGTRKAAERTLKDLERMGIYTKGSRSETPKLSPKSYDEAARIAFKFYDKSNRH